MLEPVLGALLVDHDLRGLRLRVVAADRLDHAAVTRRALIGNGDAPDRILLAPHAGESNSYGHKRPGSLAAAHQLLEVGHLARAHLLHDLLHLAELLDELVDGLDRRPGPMRNAAPA